MNAHQKKSALFLAQCTKPCHHYHHHCLALQAQNALFSPLTAPRPEQRPRLPSLPPPQLESFSDSLLESRPSPVPTVPPQEQQQIIPHVHPLLADAGPAQAIEPLEPQGMHQPTSMMNQTLMSLPAQLDSWHATDAPLPVKSQLLPNVSEYRPSPSSASPFPLGYRGSETNYMMGQLAALQSETAFQSTPAAYLQQRAKLLATQAASLRTQDLTNVRDLMASADEGPHEAPPVSTHPGFPNDTLEILPEHHTVAEAPVANGFSDSAVDAAVDRLVNERGEHDGHRLRDSEMTLEADTDGAGRAGALSAASSQHGAGHQPALPQMPGHGQISAQSRAPTASSNTQVEDCTMELQVLTKH